MLQYVMQVEASFSRSRMLIVVDVPVGCADKSISIWSTHSGQLVHALTGHAGIPTTVQWHPRRMLLASACSALALWQPDPTYLQ